jgi:hypothetical protein
MIFNKNRKTHKNDQNDYPPCLWLNIKNSNKFNTFYRKATKNDQNVPPPRLWLSIKSSNKLNIFYRKATKNDQNVPPRFERVNSLYF